VAASELLPETSAPAGFTAWAEAVTELADAAVSTTAAVAATGAVFAGAWVPGDEPAAPPNDGKFYWGFELEPEAGS
jgi:hypothetical protein